MSLQRGNVAAELNAADREALMAHMSRELSVISSELDMTPKGIAWRTGLDESRITLIASGKRKMKWSEYMSILFLLWDDENGKDVIEKYGLFPDTLKNAMAADLNHIENQPV